MASYYRPSLKCSFNIENKAPSLLFPRIVCMNKDLYFKCRLLQMKIHPSNLYKVNLKIFIQ